jgi:pimeloyl-ACP methyl ester carboxylesterase
MSAMKLEINKQRHPQETGKGTIVLVHGACMGAWVWSNNFAPFFYDRGFNTYAISLRNHGSSEQNGKLRWTSIMEYVDDLTQVVDSIDGPIYLIGHSMGGFTIQHYLQRASSKVNGAVLLCSVPNTGLWKLAGRLLFNFPLQFLISNGRMSWLPIMKNKKLLKKLMFSETISNENMESVMQKLQDESFLAFIEMVFLRLPKRIESNVPLMIVGAQNDELVSEVDTRKMASFYNIQPLIIPNASHCFMLEDGWEETAEKISAFLALH